LGSGIVLIVQSGSASLDADAILAHCRLHLPMFMLPGHIEIVAELPRNPNGKIDRKSLSGSYAKVFIGSEEPA